MLNSIGLANPGRQRSSPRRCRSLRELGVPLWVSVGGFSADDYAETCAQLEEWTIELNLSCPNVEEAPEYGSGDRRRVPRGQRACRSTQSFPLQTGTSARSPERSRRRAPTASRSSTRSAALRSTSGRSSHVSGRGPGACSGPALKPIALAAVFACRRVTRAADRRHGRGHDRTRRAGARRRRREDVALGTVLFRDPDAPVAFAPSSTAEVAALGVADVDTIRGVAHERGVAPELSVSQ